MSLGLLEDDAELDKAMDEAFDIKFGEQLGEFFVSLLMYCRPADPPKFWRDHKAQLSEDWIRQHGQENAENMVLMWLQMRLAENEIDLSLFDMPSPILTEPVVSKELAVIEAELNYNQQEQQRVAIERPETVLQYCDRVYKQ